MNPTAFSGADGRMHVAYELHVTNPGRQGALELTGLQVDTQEPMAALASYKAPELCAVAKPQCADGEKQVTIPPGGRTVLLVWLSWPPDRQILEIGHIVSFRNAQGREYTVRSAEVPVARDAAIEIGPPLEGGRFWLATDGPGNARSHHWGSLQSINGLVTIAQRFAIDFVGLDAAGHALRGKQAAPEVSPNAEWFGYGADVLAAADGVVSDSRDGQPDNLPFTAPPESKDLTPRGLYGNFVIVEIAPGVFAHYAHLRPGSVRVHAGQQVHRGEVIAQLGDSGNSEVPHLHFHISNEATFLGSEGLPYRIDGFTLEGKAGPEIVLSPSSRWSAHPAKARDAMPLDSDVLLFPKE